MTYNNQTRRRHDGQNRLGAIRPSDRQREKPDFAVCKSIDETPVAAANVDQADALGKRLGE